MTEVIERPGERLHRLHDRTELRRSAQLFGQLGGELAVTRGDPLQSGQTVSREREQLGAAVGGVSSGASPGAGAGPVTSWAPPPGQVKHVT
ncbi:hypothetical protein AB0B21_04035 [Streptomyces rimosus]|uniref:hypothetical protein n=1 Tax=Streptomyces rimosus TaxID=1927 RepID=UPI00131E17F3|nr:hypothetical protein [Streptomyces rimosus]